MKARHFVAHFLITSGAMAVSEGCQNEENVVLTIFKHVCIYSV